MIISGHQFKCVIVQIVYVQKVLTNKSLGSEQFPRYQATYEREESRYGPRTLTANVNE